RPPRIDPVRVRTPAPSRAGRASPHRAVPARLRCLGHRGGAAGPRERMMVLAGGDVVLPDRVVRGGSIVIDGGAIAEIDERAIDGPVGATRIDFAGHTIVPGFIDVHVHGIGGFDVLDGGGAVET